VSNTLPAGRVPLRKRSSWRGACQGEYKHELLSLARGVGGSIRRSRKEDRGEYLPGCRHLRRPRSDRRLSPRAARVNYTNQTTQLAALAETPGLVRYAHSSRRGHYVPQVSAYGLGQAKDTHCVRTGELNLCAFRQPTGADHTCCGRGEQQARQLLACPALP